MLVKSNSEKLLIRNNKDLICVYKEDVIYIESIGKNVIAHTNKEEFNVNTTLRDLESIMGSDFFRSHKSFIINKDKVTRVRTIGNRSYQVEFQDSEKQAMISRHRYDSFIENIM